MPILNFDGQSFLLDGRRLWLVAGALHYGRVPRGLWADRLRALKQAGLNCVLTDVCWAMHEPHPERFEFTDRADLRAFVRLVGQMGLYCVLRPGPYVGNGWDFGGMPGWLNAIPGIALRQANGPFLEASARYLGAVMNQVRDLQANYPGVEPDGPCPILLVQLENEWRCHHPQQGQEYLGELYRYLRENGCTTPISVANNLWQRVEGTLDTWHANEHLATDLRQLHVVQPKAPRIISEYRPGARDVWGDDHRTGLDAPTNVYRLAQALSSAAQFCLGPFHGGTNFGFFAGRSPGSTGGWHTTSADGSAPLAEGGAKTEQYRSLKRLAVFANHFGHVFAHLAPEQPHCAIAPTDADHPLSVIHLTGSQGQVVFVFKGRSDNAKRTHVMLPDGQVLPVPLDDQRAAWFLLGANLGGVARLTYTNLRPWALVGKRMLVLFGPPGAQGIVCLNGAVLSLNVPDGKTPYIEQHESMTVVVLSRRQVDAAVVAQNTLWLGVDGVSASGEPIPMAGWPQVYAISVEGQIALRRLPAPSTPQPPSLGDWSQHPETQKIQGEGEAFKPIEGPASLEALGQPQGYGFYRLSFPKGGSSAAKPAGFGLGGDRLHLFVKGEPTALLGQGPGALGEPVEIKPSGGLVVLADNLGRLSEGWFSSEPKGLPDHLYAIKPLELSKPQTDRQPAPDPFRFSGFIPTMRHGEQIIAETVTWKFTAQKPGADRPAFLDIDELPLRAVVLVNDTPVGLYDPTMNAPRTRLRIDGELVLGGSNRLTLAVLAAYHDTPLDQLGGCLSLHHATSCLSDKAQWAFAPWEPPAIDAYEPMEPLKGKAKPNPPTGVPTWYRCTFDAPSDAPSDACPLWLEPIGMTKGQAYLNARNAGRYFVATASGESVPPQARYYLPETWLRTEQPNELILFDEHGADPRGVRLVYDRRGPYEA